MSQGRASERSSRNPAKMTLAGIVGMVFGYFAFGATLANALYAPRPAVLLRWDSDEPRATTRMLDIALASRDPRQFDEVEGRRLKRALRLHPLSARALRQLAMVGDAEAASENAQELLTLAHKVDRRDELAQVLLAQNAARGRDLDAAVLHLSNALTTSRRGDAIVFPVLTQLLADDEGRDALGNYLDRQWMDLFLQYAASSAPSEQVFDLVDGNDEVLTSSRYRDFRAGLLSHLASEGNLDEARRFASAAPSIPSAVFDVVGFTSDTLDQNLAPLTWRALNDDGAYVSPSAEGLTISLDAGARGMLLERYFSVHGPSVELAVRTLPDRGQRNLRLEWQVSCVSGSYPDAGRRKMPVGSSPQSWSDRFALPDACSAARVRLYGRNLGDQGAAEIRLSNFTFAGRS